MKADDKRDLWRWAVHNRAFDLSSQLGELRSTFRALSPVEAPAFDSWNLIERQLRICELELESLKRVIARYEPKFIDEESSPKG